MELLRAVIKLFVDQLNEDQREFFEERAAILQYEANLTKVEAELQAMVLTKNYFNL